MEDKRYPRKGLKHIYFLHSHPEVPTNLSKRDLIAIAKIKKIHGESVQTKEGTISIGIVAFFANTPNPSQGGPACDGFLEYNLGSDEVIRWGQDAKGHWRKAKAGTVKWSSETEPEFKPEEEP